MRLHWVIGKASWDKWKRKKCCSVGSGMSPAWCATNIYHYNYWIQWSDRWWFYLAGKTDSHWSSLQGAKKGRRQHVVFPEISRTLPILPQMCDGQWGKRMLEIRCHAMATVVYMLSVLLLRGVSQRCAICGQFQLPQPTKRATDYGHLAFGIRCEGFLFDAAIFRPHLKHLVFVSGLKKGASLFGLSSYWDAITNTFQLLLFQTLLYGPAAIAKRLLLTATPARPAVILAVHIWPSRCGAAFRSLQSCPCFKTLLRYVEVPSPCIHTPCHRCSSSARMAFPAVPLSLVVSFGLETVSPLKAFSP